MTGNSNTQESVKESNKSSSRLNKIGVFIIAIVVLIFVLIFVSKNSSNSELIKECNLSGVWSLNSKDAPIFGLKEYVLYIKKDETKQNGAMLS